MMSKKESKESYKQFLKERPEEAKKIKETRKQNREMIHGKGVVTRGKNAGLKRGTLKK